MPTQRQLYTRKLDEITRRYQAREEAFVQQAVDLLRELQKEIAGQLALTPGDTFDAFRLRELRANLERQMASLEGQLANGISQASQDVYRDGGLSVIEPLQAVGYGTVFFNPSQAQILTVSEFSADLIRNLTAETLLKINAQLRRGALGELAPFEIMKEITRILGLEKRTIVKGVAYRAELITRTELGRIFNLANYNTQQDAAQYVPELLKRWLATGDGRTRETHLAAHVRYAEKPIPVKEPFIVGGAEMRYPHDPAGPAKESIGCRCRSAAVVPDIGILSSPLDGRVKAQIEKLKDKA